jgi:hypothetical protein
LVRIRDAIKVLIVDEHETIQLSARLQATLADLSLGDEAIEIATIFTKNVQENLPKWQA